MCANPENSLENSGRTANVFFDFARKNTIFSLRAKFKQSILN